MLIDQGADGLNERKNLYEPKYKYTGVANCTHVKFGGMTVVTYAENYEANDKTFIGIETALNLAKSNGTLGRFNKYPTCAPVTCSKYSFVKELDCAVFQE